MKQMLKILLFTKLDNEKCYIRSRKKITFTRVDKVIFVFPFSMPYATWNRFQHPQISVNVIQLWVFLRSIRSDETTFTRRRAEDSTAEVIDSNSTGRATWLSTLVKILDSWDRECSCVAPLAAPNRSPMLYLHLLYGKWSFLHLCVNKFVQTFQT